MTLRAPGWTPGAPPSPMLIAPAAAVAVGQGEAMITDATSIDDRAVLRIATGHQGRAMAVEATAVSGGHRTSMDPPEDATAMGGRSVLSGPATVLDRRATVLDRRATVLDRRATVPLEHATVHQFM
ncbi:unnamed protein product [Caretta caretta]